MARLLLFAPIFVSVLLSAVAQLTLKIAMSSEPIQQAIVDRDRSFLTLAVAVTTSPAILFGFFCFGLSAVMWLIVLARLEVSAAYPFSALGIAITVASGYFLLGETISPLKLAGIAAIILGVLLIGVSTPTTPLADSVERRLSQ